MNINLRAAQGTSYYEMVTHAQKVADIVRQEPLRGHVLREHRRREPVDEHGAAQRAARRRGGSGRCRPRRSRSRFGRSCCGSRGFRHSSACRPRFRSAGAGQQQLHADGRERGHGQPVSMGAAARAARSRRCPKLQDVSDDMEMKSPRVDLVVDRDQAARRRPERRTTSKARSTTASARSGRRRSTASRPSTRCSSNSIPKDQEQVDSLKKIAFKTSTGRAGSARVGHEGARKPWGRRPSTMRASFRPSRSRSACRPGVALGAAVDRIQRVASACFRRP